LAAPQADAAVTLLLGGVVVGVQSVRRFHFLGQIIRLRFELLQADDICVLLSNPGEDALAPCRPNAVEI